MNVIHKLREFWKHFTGTPTSQSTGFDSLIKVYTLDHLDVSYNSKTICTRKACHR